MTDSRSIELPVPTYIPFEPRPPERRVRDELRDRLALLPVGPGKMLAGSLAGTPPANADIENLVLFNIDDTGRLFSGGCGVQFERLPPDRRSPFVYRYAAIPAPGAFAHWREGRPLATLGEVELPDGLSERLCDRAWVATRGAGAVVVAARVAGPVALRLYVGLPERLAGSPARCVKGLIDGVIAALTLDAGSPVEAHARLAARLGIPPKVVTHLLASAPPVFGTARLLVLRGASIQWQPPDHALVAGSVQWERTQQRRISLRGTVVALSA